MLIRKTARNIRLLRFAAGFESEVMPNSSPNFSECMNHSFLVPRSGQALFEVKCYGVTGDE